MQSELYYSIFWEIVRNTELAPDIERIGQSSRPDCDVLNNSRIRIGHLSEEISDFELILRSSDIEKSSLS